MHFMVSIISTNLVRQNTEVEGAQLGGNKKKKIKHFLPWICTWCYSHMNFSPKERQEVTLLTKTLFLAAGLGKPFKDYPLLLSNTTADRTQVCPSPAIRAVSPQNSLLSTTLSSVHGSRSNPLYLGSFHQNCVFSKEVHLKTQLFSIHGFNWNLSTCRRLYLHFPHQCHIQWPRSATESEEHQQGHHGARGDPFTGAATLPQNDSSST